jgi:hypothetical protein
MKNKELTHVQSLELIEHMIATARHKTVDNGFHFLLWGVLVALTSIFVYILSINGVGPVVHFSWVIMSAVGIVVALVYEGRQGKTAQAQTQFDRIYVNLWLGFGLTLVILIFISLSYGVIPIALILALVGLATFISGVINRFRPLVVGAIIFWICAAACTQFNPNTQLLFNAMAITLGYIVPGILLWKKSKA